MIDGPAYVSFSGGLTSGFMLRRAIDEGLGPDVHVVFANTGKEREETLDFVRDCGERWAVPIRWVEYAEDGFREVTFATASRKGEPFAELIEKHGYLPHPGSPYCSSEGKFRPAKAFMESLGYDEWDALIGLRADERRRVAKLKGRKVEGGWAVMPLAEQGIHLEHVRAFWRAQPFTLQLHPHEGNCDLCWKKAGPKVRGLIDQVPSRADWWAEQERATGTRWREDRPTYAAFGDAARRQVRLFVVVDEIRDGEWLRPRTTSDPPKP